jgi:hypothetical protein
MIECLGKLRLFARLARVERDVQWDRTVSDERDRRLCCSMETLTQAVQGDVSAIRDSTASDLRTIRVEVESFKRLVQSIRQLQDRLAEEIEAMKRPARARRESKTKGKKSS